MYIPWKTQLESIVKKHFPPSISDRFSFRADSEIYIPKEDETIWNAVRDNKQSMHVLFDRLEIIEIPPSMPKNMGEYFILKSFRDAIARGTINIDKLPEYVDNATAKKNKKEKEANKKKQVEESYKFARDNQFDVKRIEAKIPVGGKKTKTITKLELPGGDK